MHIRSGTAACGDPSHPIELFYEDLGDPAGVPVLLIMGVGAQLPMWPDGFCELLVERGMRVIRFDHRDIGLSTKLHGVKADGSVYARVARYALGRGSPVPYTLVDMAEDTRGLLDHLGIERAHVVGASMGGMIAQILAGSHPDRVSSLGLLMTSPGTAFSSLPHWRVIRLAFDPPARDAPTEDKIAHEARNVAVINGPNFLPTDAELRARVRDLTARSDYPQGGLRQFDAILGYGQPGVVHQADHVADGDRARVEGSDGADSQRAQPRPHDRRGTLRGGRRDGPRSARARVAADRGGARGERRRGRALTTLPAPG